MTARTPVAREKRVRVCGTQIHIREVGDGSPVLLINGLGAHTEMWAALENALESFHLIEFDAPGTGRSGTAPLPVALPVLAWMATRVLNEVGVRRADVLGYSMGGLVAQQLALLAPRRVRRLVLVATACGLGAVPGTLEAMLNVATPLRYWSAGFYSRTIGGMVGGRARHDPQWVAQHGELRRRHRPTTRGYLGQVLGVTGWSSLPLLGHIRHPALIVTGDDDPLIPPVNAMLLASRMQSARVLTAPGEGHLLLMDSDSAVLGPIGEFLATTELDDAAVWRDGALVGEDELRAAMAATGRQLQPWGAVGTLMRQAWPMRRGRT